MVVNVLNNNIEESGGLLGRTTEVGYVQDQGVVGPVLAIQLNLNKRENKESYFF